MMSSSSCHAFVIRFDEGLTLETSAPPFYLTAGGITYLINSFDYPNLLRLDKTPFSFRGHYFDFLVLNFTGHVV